MMEKSKESNLEIMLLGKFIKLSQNMLSIVQGHGQIKLEKLIIQKLRKECVL